jgi:hypothetical protein
MNDIATTHRIDTLASRLGKIVRGAPFDIGTGFKAQQFSKDMYGGRMDPLVMVDHFVMTEPTFPPHVHTGISAVTVMFEDTQGVFQNRDTLGRDIALKGGDLYWLAAAGGAAHEEKPEEGARIHALQVFVDLPAPLKTAPARALYVDAQDVPVLAGPGRRVRVVLGRSGEAVGEQDTPEEMTLLDGFLEQGGFFAHLLPEEHQAWVYAVSGSLTIRCLGEERVLEEGDSTTVAAGAAAEIGLESGGQAHFVLMAGRPVFARNPTNLQGSAAIFTDGNA